jgi:hypothetical protein
MDALDGGPAKPQQSPAIREFLSYEADVSRAETGMPAKWERISWEEARNMILRGWVRFVSQGHSREVNLVTSHGTGFVARQGAIDEVIQVVRSVDPCMVFIRVVTE